MFNSINTHATWWPRSSGLSFSAGIKRHPMEKTMQNPNTRNHRKSLLLFLWLNPRPRYSGPGSCPNCSVPHPVTALLLKEKTQHISNSHKHIFQRKLLLSSANISLAAVSLTLQHAVLPLPMVTTTTVFVSQNNPWHPSRNSEMFPYRSQT